MVAVEAPAGQQQMEKLKFLTPEVRCSAAGQGSQFGPPHRCRWLGFARSSTCPLLFLQILLCELSVAWTNG